MTKKRLTLAIGAFLAIGFCLALAGLERLAGRPCATEANIDRIREGMTMAEVEQILGGEQVWFVEDQFVSHYWKDVDGSWGRVRMLNGRVYDNEWARNTESPIKKLGRWLRWH